MGSYLDKPVTEKISESGSGNNLTWGSSCMQGWRTGMEDAHITLPSLRHEGDLESLASLALFGVFDGHGGKEVALFCKDHIPTTFCKYFKDISRRKCNDPSSNNIGNDASERKERQQGEVESTKQNSMIADALTRSFHQMDDMLRLPEYYEPAFPNKAAAGSPSGGPQKPRVIQMMEEKLKDRVEADMAQAKKDGRIGKQDAEKLGIRMNMLKKLSAFPAEGMEMSDPAGPAAACGCTANCVAITPLHIICANSGDSRSVLCRGGAAKAMSDDHKPNKPSERTRIEAAGGAVEAQQAPNGGRIQHRVRPGGLSLSRAIGDLQGKARPDLMPEQQVICATPEVHVEPRVVGEDEFIVIACDGIWDVKSNGEACDFIRRRLFKGVALTTIIEELLDSCMCKDPKQTSGIGGDNMTCIVVLLQSKEFFVEKSAAGRNKSCFPYLCGRSRTTA